MISVNLTKQKTNKKKNTLHNVKSGGVNKWSYFFGRGWQQWHIMKRN
jgi:hypothetical protein